MKDYGLILTTLEAVPGRRIAEHLGIVQGSSIRAKHVGHDIGASIKNFFGGELSSYTALMSESRDEAIARMVEQARSINANAVLNIRFSTASIAQGAAELLVYGTAVKLA